MMFVFTDPRSVAPLLWILLFDDKEVREVTNHLSELLLRARSGCALLLSSPAALAGLRVAFQPLTMRFLYQPNA